MEIFIERVKQDDFSFIPLLSKKEAIELFTSLKVVGFGLAVMFWECYHSFEITGHLMQF